MTSFYSGRVGLSRLFIATTTIFLLLFTLTFGSWWAIGRSSGAEGVASTLIANDEVRTGVAEKLIDQVTSDADDEVKAVLTSQREQLVAVVSEVLASPEISSETQRIINQVYSFYTGESESASIDVNALVLPILKSMATVDPAFNVDDVDVSGIEPITLEDSGNSPNLAPVKSGLAIAVFLLFIFLLLSLGGLAKYSKSKRSFVGSVGWTFGAIGAILMIIYFGGTNGVASADSSATDPLVNSAAPIVAQTFLSMFRLEGILLLLVGLIGVTIWARTKEARPGQ
jgi:hypothetical protein